MGLLDFLLNAHGGGGILGGSMIPPEYQGPPAPQPQYQPPSGFMNPYGGQAPIFPPPDPSAFNPQQTQTYANMPGSPAPALDAPRTITDLPIGNPQQQQMPDQTAQAQLPPNARPAEYQGQQPQQQAPQQPQPPQGPDFGDRLMAGFQGFANAGGPLPALGNLIGGLATGQRTDPAGMRQQGLQSTYQSLVAAGVPHAVAQAAALNPEVAKAIIPQYLGSKPQWTQTGEDAFGNKQFGFVDPINSTVNGQPASGAQAQGGSSSGFLAPGVKQIDSNLIGDEYLKQFSPEVQQATKDYIDGKTMPTGNPRKGFTQAVEMVARKYGADIGQPVDAATFAARRQMRTDISKSSPNSMGGILSNGKSAFEHLRELSDSLVNVGNSNGYNGPGGGLAANVYNRIGNELGTSQTKGALNNARDTALKYGQEATKFYAGTGGGEAERMNAMKTLSPESSSPNEMAGFLKAEKSLMYDRLSQKEAQIRDTLGDNYLKEHPVITPELKDTLSKIDDNIAKLEGRNTSAPTARVDPIEAEMRKRGLLK